MNDALEYCSAGFCQDCKLAYFTFVFSSHSQKTQFSLMIYFTTTKICFPYLQTYDKQGRTKSTCKPYNSHVNLFHMICSVSVPFISSGPCGAGCLQVPVCYHYIWDDPWRMPWTQRCGLALCNHRWGPPPQEQELQAARGLQTYELGK